ncbi:hypothetical protein [Bordetella genomosp. 9]|uniref:Uncharacterized protein n=1 Tax=Bordetella genomosp. 9 TaxID=1416803 RepID=A0A1W6Z2J5_9BORD|nr:hypothetical protein [Bordetella genomosp. 9]ARP87329.1 hypothetical protein CAL13_14790 [Bordetella genomosp. 9]ARP91313.1 hypothetical protein CAL14_14315 [Bordetella genomosp. 9]
MDYRDNDPAIPTLTHKLDAINEPPVLTDVVSRPAAPLPPDPVLRAALQAELEHTVQQALDQAMTHVRASLEAELPALVERVVNRLRPG